MTRLTLFAGGVFAVESGFFAVIPPLVPRLARDAHLSTTEVGVLVAAYPAGVVAGAVPSIMLVERWVIAREEGYLERRFGDAYRAYKARVRRWL